MGNHFGYMRISTAEEREKQKYTRQEAALHKYAAQQKTELVLVFKEDISGKSFDDRAEWQRLEKLLHPGDTVVFKDITRFTREAENGYRKYMELMKQGIELVFLDNPTVSTAYIKNLLDVAERQSLVAKTALESTVKLLLICELDRAEQERLAIVKRTKDGMAARKAEAEAAGLEWRAGRKPGHLDKMTDALRVDILLYLDDRTIRGSVIAKKHGISMNTFRKYAKIVKAERIGGDA